MKISKMLQLRYFTKRKEKGCVILEKITLLGLGGMKTTVSYSANIKY